MKDSGICQIRGMFPIWIFCDLNSLSNLTYIEKQLKKESKEERQLHLEQIFFKRMYSFSKGNITKAILFARNSAYNVKDKTVFVKPIEIKEIEDLSLNELFILEAIFQHRSLTIKELNIVLRNSDRQSRLSIEKLLEQRP